MQNGDYGKRLIIFSVATEYHFPRLYFLVQLIRVELLRFIFNIYSYLILLCPLSSNEGNSNALSLISLMMSWLISLYNFDPDLISSEKSDEQNRFNVTHPTSLTLSIELGFVPIFAVESLVFEPHLCRQLR